jgi:hypothetical protein
MSGENRMPHRRSNEAYERRTKRKNIRRVSYTYILEQSWNCRIWAERVSRTSQEELYEHVVSAFPDEGVVLGYVPEVENGLILSDSRGRGALQR